MKAVAITPAHSAAIFVARLEDGDHALLELVSGEVRRGDVIASAALDEVGEIQATNQTTGRVVLLYGQSGRCSLGQALAILGRTM
jgi:hypothetical protein